MGRSGTWRTGVLLASGAIALVLTFRAHAQAQFNSQASIDALIREKLNLADYQLQSIAPRPDRRPQDLQVDVILGGALAKFTLQPYSIRSGNYRLLAADAKGRFTPMQPGPINTYRGTAVGHDDLWAAASFFDGKLSMLIDDSVETWWVQPLSNAVPGAPADQYVVYRHSDVMEDGSRCGTIDLGHLPIVHIGPPPDPPACIASADIAIDADFEYFSLPGLGSVPAVEADINSIMNAVEFIYRRDCEIAYDITTIIVRFEEPDPYGTTFYGDLLPEFQDYWNANHCPTCAVPIDRDVTHLFTGKDIDDGPGGVIGVAYLPGVCTPTDAYGLSQSRFSTSYAARVRLTAHELGHNWNAPHCSTGDPTCSIMCPSVSGCNQTTMEFEQPGSADFIINYRNSLTCLGAAGAASFGTERLIPSPPLDHDNFGYSVDLSADVLIGGAPQNLPAPPFKPGAAYVFRLDTVSNMWMQDGPALRPNPLDGFDEDRFGISVALASASAGSLIGDVAVIGAHLDDDGGRSSGSAYIFRNTGGAWSQAQKIIAFDDAPSDLFGFSVSISPAGTVVVISSHGDDDNFGGSGSAYVYRWNGTLFEFEEKLHAPDPAAFDSFGFSVSVSGPNGLEVALIGAHADDDMGLNSGSAYVFRCDGFGTWNFEQKLTAADGIPADQFGLSVAIHSTPTIDYALIGAPMADSATLLNTGAAYLYQSTGGGIGSWTPVIKFQAADSKAQDQFGTSVGLSEFVAIVGNYLDDAVALNSGSAYVFRNSSGSWALDTKMIPSDAAEQDQFGISVAAFGERVAVGAWRAETPAAEGGAVYVTTDVVDFEDCNKNGAPDDCEIAQGLTPDCNLNKIPDDCDIAAGTSIDCNANNVPDECDILDPLLDCNANGIPDTCDIDAGTSSDCNQNDVPDECETPVGALPDCNINGIPDICDIFDGTSQDCNANGVPDECDIPGTKADCNLNGVPDSCDIAGGTSEDCNNNGIPDECDAPFVGVDCNSNGIPDSCELATNDCNDNGVPDDCDIADNLREDCNLNKIPDSCEIAGGAPDCNNNSIPDSCDVAIDDCNGNLIPDECDVASGLAQDCNVNLVPDSCDIASGMSTDSNGNGIPDECDIFDCPPDVTGDGTVNILDLLAIINAWGPCSGCSQDIAPPPAGDGVVNVLDMLQIINSWGPCAS